MVWYNVKCDVDSLHKCLIKIHRTHSKIIYTLMNSLENEIIAFSNNVNKWKNHEKKMD